MKRKSPILDEKTRMSLSFSNLWPIVVAIFLFGVSITMFTNRMTTVETKLDILIQNEKDLSGEFKLWKSQYEGRLGRTELDVKGLATMMGVKESDSSAQINY